MEEIKKKIEKTGKSIEHVFMKINFPKFLEKKILTSAVMTTQLLKNCENFLNIREKRTNKIDNLKRSIVDIHKDLVSFKKKFPKVSGEEILEKEPKINLENMNDLDKELYLIEKRLKEI